MLGVFLRLFVAGFSLALAGVLALAAAHSAHAEATLHGRAFDARTREPIAAVRVTLDSLVVRTSASDGTFEFESLQAGWHVLVFEHVAYATRRVSIQWPSASPVLLVELEPRFYQVAPIKVTAERAILSLPVSSVSFTREATTLTAGNIANDPLRTVQSHPSAASAGVDFLSAMAVRGGDTEELRVYFDDFPLRHYAHLGGFSSVVYDDMLESTILVPGAAPIRYQGTLSGIVVFAPQNPETSSTSARYDITSMALGVNRVASSDLKLQVAAKSSFFNLPVYQQLGVDDRSFRDLLARVIWSPRESLALTPTLLLAKDSETGSPLGGVAQEREVFSTLAGIECLYQPSLWEFKLRPYFSYYESRDALTWSASDREHRLTEVRMAGEISRQGSVVGIAVLGEAGSIQHDGYGNDRTDTPFSAASELRLIYRDAAALVLGGGGSREEWTSKVEPEVYGSLRVNLGERLSLCGAGRRSHQTPFVFSERRYFASVPLDAGDLMLGFDPTQEARSVRIDQASVEAHLELPLHTSIEGNGFWRRYDGLLAWDWTAFPTPRGVTNGGSGRGEGYEVTLARNDLDLFSFSVSASRARVWKTEGTLAEERVGDFDKPDGWQAAATVRLSHDLRVSVRWTDVDGRPYTQYWSQTTPPPDDQVNAMRLDRFQRLDVKLTVDTFSAPFHVTVFLDLVNLLNHRNIATMYALETSPGEFTTVPYGGTTFFPIGGVNVRW
jgi:hypothetical protein